MTRTTLKIFAVLIGAAALAAFNLLSDPGPSAQQREYRVWAAGLETIRKDNGKIPVVEAAVRGGGGDRQPHWKLRAVDRAGYDRVLRIIELLGEARGVELRTAPAGAPLPVPPEGGFLISAADARTCFYALATPAQVAASIQLQNLLTLAQLSPADDQKVAGGAAP